MEKQKKILIINLGGIGDILLSFPALKALRDFYQGYGISMLVTSRAYQLIKGLSYIDEAFAFSVEYGGSFGLRKFINNFRILFSLKKERFELAINMRTILSDKSARKIKFMLDIINPQKKAGRDTEGRGSFFDIRIPETDLGDKCEMEYDINMVKALGGEVTDKNIALGIEEGIVKKVEGMLRDSGLPGVDEALVCIHPGGMPSRRWPVENFAVVINALNAKVRCKFIITGAADESGLVRIISSRVHCPVIDFTGKLSVLDLAALIKKCSLFISNDTGPMHIAASLKVPQVAILGPGDIKRYNPCYISDKAVVLYKKADCSPCFKISCGELKCLSVISPEEVIDAALRGIARDKGNPVLP